MSKNRIYLDNNASTFLDPKIIDFIQKTLKELEGNPSSVHGFGQKIRNKISLARREIASFFKVRPDEIVFTSGGTESMNMIISGCLKEKGEILSSNVEHACVEEVLSKLEKQGNRITYLPVYEYGAVTPSQLEEAVTPQTKMIVLTAANNETGVKTDLEGIARLALEKKIPFVVDGVALLGKEEFSIPKGVTAMGFSGHKIHSLQGTGFVFLRKNAFFTPFLHGSQENNKRGGTENVLGILCLQEAVKLLKEEKDSMEKMRRQRIFFEEELKKQFKEVHIHGTGPKISNTVSFSIEGVDGESLLMSLDLEGIAVSHGSACSTGALEPSRVFLNMGIDPSLARSAIRISLSRFTTDQEIQIALRTIAQIIKKL